MSVFELRAGRHLVVVRVPEDSVTGAFEPYLQQLEDAVDATNATPSQVTPAAENVVNAAGSIPSADLEVVAAAANFAIGSSQTWYEFGQGGGFDTLQMEQSIFRLQGWWNLLKRFVMYDVAGCLYGAVVAFAEGRLGEMMADCVGYGLAWSAGQLQQQ